MASTLPIFAPTFGEEEKRLLMECIDTGWISSQGAMVAQFEEEFATWHGMAHGVAASNCTSALHLALVALGVGVGDEVVCPALTFIAPANMVALSGASVVLVDVEPDSWAIDPNVLASAVTPRTKAVIVVHPFGHVANMDPIVSLSHRHGFKIIEDVAEAPGAKYQSRLAGTFGAVSCFSFFGNKIMTTGEGGMVLTNDESLQHNLRIYRDHGMSREKKYHHLVVGFNYRMTNMQAAIGLGQLRRLAEIIRQREQQDNWYRQKIAACKDVGYRPNCDYSESVHWLATISLPEPELRDPLIAYMAEHGVECRPMIFPVNHAVPFQNSYPCGAFPVSERVSSTSLHLPSGLSVTETQVERICALIDAWMSRH